MRRPLRATLAIHVGALRGRLAAASQDETEAIVAELLALVAQYAGPERLRLSRPDHDPADLAEQLRVLLEQVSELDDPAERDRIHRAAWSHLRAVSPECAAPLSVWRPTEPIKDPREEQEQDDGSTPPRAA